MQNNETGDVAIANDRPGSLRHGPLWLDLRHHRRILLPLANRTVQEYCLQFFIWGRWHRLFTRLGLMAGRWSGLMSLFPKLNAEQMSASFGDALSSLAQLPPTDQPYLAVRIGSPGPYQKASVLTVSNDGTGQSFIKLALRASADRTIAQENVWLEKLAAIPAVSSRVPTLLQTGNLPSGRAFLKTSVSPTLGTRSDFTKQHELFLADLGHVTCEWRRYSEADEAAFIAEALGRLTPVFSQELHDELTIAWQDALASLGDWSVPLVLAHRDFAPWNIRWHEQGIFVFDWEYATAGANPLHDIFHFHLVQDALSRWRRLTPGTAHCLVVQSLKYAQRTYPEGSWSKAQASALLLAYLLYVVLFYTDSGQLFDPRHPILSSYLTLIRSRRQWM